jgi:protein ImuB
VRTACLRVPDLPLAAELRASPELAGQPLAIAAGAGPRAELIAVSPEARHAGVRALSSVAHARAVCGDLQVRVASPALEGAARAALLDAALSFSPRAALAPPVSGPRAAEAAVFLDATGTASLFRSEQGLGSALAARASRLGLPGPVAVASSRSVALIAARSLQGGEAPEARAASGTRAKSKNPVERSRILDDVLVLSPGEERRFLTPLPVDVLDPDDALADALTRFGVRTVGDLLRLPRRALTARLGPQALALVRRALGDETEPLLSVPARAVLAESIDLEHAIERLEPLAFVLQGVLSRLLARLEVRHLACGDLSLHLELQGGGRDARRVAVAAPTLDLRVLVRLVCHALEARPPGAPVEGVGVETEGRSVRADQLDLFRPAGPAPGALATTLAELEALCGDGQVGAPQVADSHHPEAFGCVRFEPGGIRDGNASDSVHPGPVLALRALRPAVPAEVRLAGGCPVWIRSAVASGRVVRAAGPWRVTGGWWSREQHFAFDHFDVLIGDGSVARLRLDHVRKTWHVDAVYD